NPVAPSALTNRAALPVPLSPAPLTAAAAKRRHSHRLRAIGRPRLPPYWAGAALAVRSGDPPALGLMPSLGDGQ
ncbi:unnamed protein product, partial [Urochloa humidicola]